MDSHDRDERFRFVRVDIAARRNRDVNVVVESRRRIARTQKKILGEILPNLAESGRQLLHAAA